MKSAVVRVACSLSLLALLVGCSNQGEGGRCLVSDDCESGLSCVAVQNSGDSFMLCCPTNPQKTRVAECISDLKVSTSDAGSNQDDASSDASDDSQAADAASDTQSPEASTSSDSSSDN